MRDITAGIILVMFLVVLILTDIFKEGEGDDRDFSRGNY